jgi:hypothetical protein
MPGSVSLNAPSYLPALVGSRLQGNSLLAALSGKSGLAPNAIELEAAPGPAQPDAPQMPTVVEAELQFKRDIAQFTQALGAANTPAQLLANPAALRVILTAHGLADQAGNSALATRALLSNPARSNSLLNQLKDPRWLAVNHLYAFATQGLAVLRNPDTVAGLCRCYGAALETAAAVKPGPTMR